MVNVYIPNTFRMDVRAKIYAEYRSVDELRELVADPLPKTLQILDFDDGKVILTDDEVKAFLTDTFGLRQPADLQLYNRERRNDILREVKQYGASIRQLARLTGLGFSIVREA